MWGGGAVKGRKRKGGSVKEIGLKRKIRRNSSNGK
jgi:hypothetical protein